MSGATVDSPCVLTTSEYGWSANIECIIKAQTVRDYLKKKAVADKSDKVIMDCIWMFAQLPAI